jgi:hypothetical protein
MPKTETHVPKESTPADAATLVEEATRAVREYLAANPGRHSMGEVLDAVTTSTLPEDAVVLAIRGLIEAGQASLDTYQVASTHA